MKIIQKADGFEAQKLIVLPEAFLEDASPHSLLKPLYVTDIGFFPHARYHYRERSNGCDEHIFIYCAEGEGWVILERGKKQRIPKGRLLVIPAKTPHIYGASEDDPWSIYWFHLKGEAVVNFVQQFDMLNATLHVPSTQATKIINLFEECYSILQYKGYSLRHYLYVSQALHYLLGMCILLHGEAQEDDNKKEVIERAIQYMLEQIQSSLTLDDLAHHVNLSKPHFIHMFKQVTGYSPIDYYLRLKMQRSCLYLDMTNASIKEVSKSVGIHDPYYFSRVFRKVIGQSPSDYRRSRQG
ncbi:transcriptional regulator [Ktedonobacter sp. SOSP1-52]|uniref:AraC family transcriptional regulator n=1 Tax=Ktedonobacter sp. SOSP1-52 TaxID=2778366 RepID=UPI0019153B1F|nr:AraC family transcriptional regulator [Ktedonobacter sp. SOSP1-52]GHO68151.1 transcriptional regulator [Ktedonobacter sp. SOSP1-52]